MQKAISLLGEDIEPMVELMTEIFENAYHNSFFDYTGDNTALRKAGFVDAGL